MSFEPVYAALRGLTPVFATVFPGVLVCLVARVFDACHHTGSIYGHVLAKDVSGGWGFLTPFGTANPVLFFLGGGGANRLRIPFEVFCSENRTTAVLTKGSERDTDKILAKLFSF